MLASAIAIFFILSLVLGKLGTLEVRLDSQPQLPPEPGLTNVVVPDGSLETIESKLLVLHFLEDQSRGLSSGLSLKPRQNFTNPVFTNLFHVTQNTSSEEYLGVTKTPLLRVKSNSLEDTSSSILVLLCLSNSSSSQDIVTRLELRVQNLVGEALPANGNASQYTITLVLMHNQARINHSRLLVGVGDHTTDEGRISGIQSLHQIIKLALVEGSDSLATTLLLTTTTSILLNFSGLTRMIIEDAHKKRIAAILEKLNNGVIEGILVLLKPSSQVVGDSGSIMDNSKMSIWIRLRAGLLEVGAFSQQVLMKLGTEGCISGLREERFLFKDGKETHGLLKHSDTSLQIHTKVHIGPFNTFLDIFFLLQHKHVLVEELLELIITEVNANLLKPIVVKDLKTSNVQATNVLHFLHGGVKKCFITLLHNETEQVLIDLTSNTRDRAGSHGTSLTLGYPFSTNLQLWLTEVGDHPFLVNATDISNLLSIGLILDFSLLLFAHWDKVLSEITHVHDNSSKLIDVVFFLIGESQDIIGFISIHHVLLVINRRYSSLALGDPPVVIDVVGQEAFLLAVRDLIRHDVVEGMIAPFQFSLESQTRLLKQVDNHVSSRQLATSIEPNTDELTKTGGVVIPHSLGIAPGLKDRFSFLLLSRGTNGSKVGNNLLGVLSFASTRLTSNENGLILAIVHHTLVGAFSNTKDMRGAFSPPQTNVHLHGTLGVDGETNVGVDGNTEETRVGVDKLVLVPNHRVPQDTGISKVSQTSHVIRAIKLGGIDLLNLVLLKDFDISTLQKFDRDFVSISRINQTFPIATGGLVRDPA